MILRRKRTCVSLNQVVNYAATAKALKRQKTKRKSEEPNTKRAREMIPALFVFRDFFSKMKKPCYRVSKYIHF